MKRRLSREEAQLWARVARTVAPLNPSLQGRGTTEGGGGTQASGPDIVGQLGRALHVRQKDTRVPLHQPAAGPPPRAGEDRRRSLDAHGLDASWDKKLARGLVSPDFTLDLHGHSLDAAHVRLDAGLAQAKALQARLVLVITGRPRPAEAADRGSRRGAIRAKVLDWLALGDHASDIAAVRSAHRRHGGAGAIYVVLRRRF